LNSNVKRQLEVKLPGHYLIHWTFGTINMGNGNGFAKVRAGYYLKPTPTTWSGCPSGERMVTEFHGVADVGKVSMNANVNWECDIPSCSDCDVPRLDQLWCKAVRYLEQCNRFRGDHVRPSGQSEHSPTVYPKRCKHKHRQGYLGSVWQRLAMVSARQRPIPRPLGCTNVPRWERIFEMPDSVEQQSCGVVRSNGHGVSRNAVCLCQPQRRLCLDR